jgi:predicted Zn-dependent peptidase
MVRKGREVIANSFLNTRPGIFLLLFLCCALWMRPDEALAQSTLKLPAYSRTKLPNGLVLLLMEQHEVPIVSFNVLVRAGAVTDPAGREGLASVTAELLRRGTALRTADRIAAELDFIGGTLDFEAGIDYTRGTAEFLKKDVDTGLDLLADVLLNANFPEGEFGKLIPQRIDSLKQEKDEPQAVIRSYFHAFLFGDHPYARPVNGDERSLAAIRAGDLPAFYRRTWTPAATTIAVVGDFPVAEMERLLTEKFGAWRPHKTAKRPPPPAEPHPLKGRKLLLVNKPDATQTFFMLGNVGIDRVNPERAGIDVVNTIFGGRFTSMLNEALRVNSGLTYGARSSFERTQVPGAFAISTYTQNATTVQALDMALDVLRQLRERGISEDQLRSAKAYLKGQYPPRIETTDQLAALLTELDFSGLDQREINEYFARIDILTADDASRIIQRYYPKDDLAFTLIGKADEIREAVKKYAPVIEERDIRQIGFH